MKLLITYIAITVIFLTDVTLYLSNGISLPGHLADWLLFWVWIISTLVILIKYRRTRSALIYGMFLIAFVILTMIPMMLPFISILAFAIDASDKRYPVTDKIELVEIAAPIALPKVGIVKSFGFYEKIIGETENSFEVGDDYFMLRDAIEIKKVNTDNDSLKVEFRFENGTVTKSL